MEALELEQSETLDFQNNGIESNGELETLQRTYKENDIYGNPVRGIYHYQVIQRMTDMCRRHNLNYEVEAIFAAQNKNRTQPGVVVLPQVMFMERDGGDEHMFCAGYSRPIASLERGIPTN